MLDQWIDRHCVWSSLEAGEGWREEECITGASTLGEWRRLAPGIYTLPLYIYIYIPRRDLQNARFRARYVDLPLVSLLRALRLLPLQ